MIPEKPGPYIATLTPKLYHYALGVGMLSFDLKLDEVSVPEFYAIKHMISRHSGQYEIWSINEEGNPQRLFSHARLIDIADLIISGYSKWFLDFYKSENPKIAVYKPEPWIEVEKAWFTHFEIYRIQDEEGNQMDAEELKMHHEYAGIMSYQRADRSSLDDWVNLSVESMHLTNLALIRAHKGDLYILSENHSICYLPDDPKFVVRQYGETSKWVFLIRCLMLYCLTESHRVLAVLKSEMSRLYASEGFQHEVKLNELKTHLKELKIKRMEIQRHRVLTISILEHAVSIGVSQYADHGLLLKRAFEETGVIQIIDRLQDRTERLATIQEDITNSMVDLKASQEELSAQQLNLLLLILTSVQMVVVVDVIYRIAGEGYPKVWKFMVYVLLSLGAIWGGIRIYTILSLRRPKRRDNLKNVKQK
jgi:hypothetical protein